MAAVCGGYKDCDVMMTPQIAALCTLVLDATVEAPAAIDPRLVETLNAHAVELAGAEYQRSLSKSRIAEIKAFALWADDSLKAVEDDCAQRVWELVHACQQYPPMDHSAPAFDSFGVMCNTPVQHLAETPYLASTPGLTAAPAPAGPTAPPPLPVPLQMQPAAPVPVLPHGGYSSDVANQHWAHTSPLLLAGYGAQQCMPVQPVQCQTLPVFPPALEGEHLAPALETFGAAMDMVAASMDLVRAAVEAQARDARCQNQASMPHSEYAGSNVSSLDAQLAQALLACCLQAQAASPMYPVADANAGAMLPSQQTNPDADAGPLALPTIAPASRTPSPQQQEIPQQEKVDVAVPKAAASKSSDRSAQRQKVRDRERRRKAALGTENVDETGGKELQNQNGKDERNVVRSPPDQVGITASTQADALQSEERAAEEVLYPLQDLLQRHQKALQCNPRRVFIVQQINRLGHKFRDVLRKHFSQYGEVSKIFAAHSKFKTCKHGAQPGGLGLIVMTKSSQVDSILKVGRDQQVADCVIQVQSLEGLDIQGAIGGTAEQIYRWPQNNQEHANQPCAAVANGKSGDTRQESCGRSSFRRPPGLDVNAPESPSGKSDSNSPEGNDPSTSRSEEGSDQGSSNGSWAPATASAIGDSGAVCSTANAASSNMAPAG